MHACSRVRALPVCMDRMPVLACFMCLRYMHVAVPGMSSMSVRACLRRATGSRSYACVLSCACSARMHGSHAGAGVLYVLALSARGRSWHVQYECACVPASCHRTPTIDVHAWVCSTCATPTHARRPLFDAWVCVVCAHGAAYTRSQYVCTSVCMWGVVARDAGN